MKNNNHHNAFSKYKFRQNKGILWSILLGLFFSLTTIAGYSFDYGDSFEAIAQRPAFFAIVAVALWIIFAVVWECAYRLLLHIGKRLNVKQSKQMQSHSLEKSTNLGKTQSNLSKAKVLFKKAFDGKYILLANFVVLVLLWTPWFISVHAGITDADTTVQFLQAYDVIPATNHHPYFATQVFHLFWALGNKLGSFYIGLRIYEILQLVIFAFGISFCLSYAKKWGCPLALRTTILIICGIFAPFPLIGLFMAKDALCAVFFLPWLTMFADIALTRGKSLKSIRFIVLFIILGFICCMSKKTMLYIITISLVLFGIYIFACSKKRAKKHGNQHQESKNPKLASKIAICLVAILVPFLIYEQVYLPAIGVPQGSSAEFMSVPSVQIARYVQKHELEETELESFSRVYNTNPEEMASTYVPRRADNSKAYWKSDSSLSDKLSFAKTYCKLFIKDPQTFIAGAWNLQYDYFYPAKKFTIQTYPSVQDKYLDIYVDNLSPENREIFFGELIEKMNQELESPSLLYSAYATLLDVPVIGWFFSLAFYCTWLPALCLMVFCRLDWKRGAFCLLPVGLNLLTLLLGPISLCRYVVEPISFSPVLLALLFSCICKQTSHTQSTVRVQNQ